MKKSPKLKSSLGRGLDAILGDVEHAYSSNISKNEVIEVSLDKISPNALQPRKTFDENELKELCDSILEHGLLQPIIIFRPDPMISDVFNIIAGERRFRASKMAGFKTIKAIIAKIPSQNLEKIRELALIENIQRKDLNPLELALSYQEMLKNQNLTHDALARKIKKSRASITNTLRILQLPNDIKEAILNNKITHGHAKILAGLDEKIQKIAFDKILSKNLSVQSLDELSKKMLKNAKDPHEPHLSDALLDLLTQMKSLNLKSKIHKKGILIQFDAPDQIYGFKKLLANKRV
ncbi:MAG: ParB/RepB/Spo0J family partition protein [Helicobacter sp.]|nr:ParB/RepB/Spo0J family partition protein [Helicobacter sp.]